MFSPEDTIVGFVAGLAKVSANDVELDALIERYLDLDNGDLHLLFELLVSEYGIQRPYSDAVGWITVQDVIDWVHAEKVDRNAGIDMLPEVVS